MGSCPFRCHARLSPAEASLTACSATTEADPSSTPLQPSAIKNPPLRTPRSSSVFTSIFLEFAARASQEQGGSLPGPRVQTPPLWRGPRFCLPDFNKMLRSSRTRYRPTVPASICSSLWKSATCGTSSKKPGRLQTLYSSQRNNPCGGPACNSGFLPLLPGLHRLGL